ncbi:Periplasmic binding protein [uncultured archaeon]|nr:Periplasmic binding protein [uncultured archaeon]
MLWFSYSVDMGLNAGKASLILLSIGIIVLLLLGCIAPAQTAKEYKIGALVPLTGNYATIGNNVKNGMDLAEKDIEANKGVSLSIIYEDVCLPKDTVSAFNKLEGLDKIDILGASFCIIGFVPVMPLAEEKKIISLSIAASPDMMLDKNYVFTLNKSIKSDAFDMASYAVRDLNAKTASVIFYNTQLGSDYNLHLSEDFASLGGKILSTHVTELDKADYRTEIAQIKNSGAEVVYIIQLANSLGLFLKQSKELGLSAIIISQSTAEDPSVISSAQGGAEGMIISSSSPKITTPQISAFSSEYQKAFGKSPDVLAAIAYDSLMLEVSALNKCGKDVLCMRNEFSSIKNYSGASGLITMGADGSTQREPNFKIVKNGEFVQIE